MQAPSQPREVNELLLETSVCRAQIDGVPVDLPPKEFQLLAELASKPGEAMSARDLIKEVWPENSLMTPQDLYWYIWRLRKRVGDDGRGRKLIGNRPRVGYLLDLPPEAIVVRKLAEPELGSESGEDREPQVKTARRGRRRRYAMRVGLAMATLVVIAGTSWGAAYTVSRARRPAAAPHSPAPTTQAPVALADQSRQRHPHRKSHDRRQHRHVHHRHGRHGSRDPGASAPAQQVVVAAPAAPATIDHSTTSKAKKQPTTSHVHHTAHKPPPPPQPDISLYVLYNAKTEDHYTTTSSATSNKMQSEGYAASVAGEGFSSNIQGTVAVPLDSGTVYVYRSEAAAPTGESVNALYRLALDGDVYFTSNWSKAEQAATRGWSKQLVGYIY